MKPTHPTRRDLSVLIGTSEPLIENCLRLFITKILGESFEPQFTIKDSDVGMREAWSIDRHGLVLFFINTVRYAGVQPIRFDLALDLIREFKRNEETIVITITTFRPPGFASAAEQAGADAIMDAPFTIDELEKAIRAPLEARNE